MLASVILTNAETVISACWVVNPKQTHEDNHTPETPFVGEKKRKKPFTEGESMFEFRKTRVPGYDVCVTLGKQDAPISSCEDKGMRWCPLPSYLAAKKSCFLRMSHDIEEAEMWGQGKECKIKITDAIYRFCNLTKTLCNLYFPPHGLNFL